VQIPEVKDSKTAISSGSATLLVALTVFQNKKVKPMSITGLCYCRDRFNSILTLTVSVYKPVSIGKNKGFRLVRDVAICKTYKPFIQSSLTTGVIFSFQSAMMILSLVNNKQ